MSALGPKLFRAFFVVSRDFLLFKLNFEISRRNEQILECRSEKKVVDVFYVCSKRSVDGWALTRYGAFSGPDQQEQ